MKERLCGCSVPCFLRALAPFPFRSLSWFLIFHSGNVFFNATTQCASMVNTPKNLWIPGLSSRNAPNSSPPAAAAAS